MKTVMLALTGLALVSSVVARNIAHESLLRALNRKATTTSSGRILGGEDAKLGQFPWQASMDDSWYGHICGGSIISDRFVVTAAHCADAVNNNPSGVTMRVGLVDLGGSSTDAKVKAIHQHEKWDPSNLINDIAIMELAEPLTFNENIQPLAIGFGVTPSSREFECTASGWGATDGNGWFYPDDLQYIDLTFYSDEKCAGHWNPVGVSYSNNSHMCAGKANGDSVCFGDSGGPLVCKSEDASDDKYYLFGATSFGNNPCGQVAYPAVWTDLANFKDWIENVTGEL